MNKREFLAELRERLAGLPEADVNRSLDYYAEMIDDRMEDGLSEEAAIEAVGTPGEIAGEILGDIPLTKLEKARVKPRRKMAVWEIVLLVIGSPLWICLLVVILMTLISVYITAWSFIIGSWCMDMVLGLEAFIGLRYVPAEIAQGSTWFGIGLLGRSFIRAGLTIFLFHGCKFMTKGLCRLSKKLFRRIKGHFIRKEAVR